MDLQDILWLSLKDLSEKKVRTALTITMVVIGVAAIVALTSITAGISKSISSELSTLGPTSIIVSSTGPTGFTIADSASLASLPNVTSVVPVLTGSGTLYSGNENTSVTIVGVSPQQLSGLIGQNLTLYQGIMYQDTINPSVVIGHSVAFPQNGGGGQNVKVGQAATLKIDGRNSETVEVPVVGILSSYSSFIVPIDTSVFMSMQAASLLLHKSSFNVILVIASNISTVNSTATLISNIYGSNVRILTTSSLLSTASSITGSLGLLFGAIAGVSLLVAAIGIMNIMLIAVYERTHEIGIMKSVGFKNRNVMTIFLLQALMIGLIGGVVGIGLGAGASYGLSAVLTRGGSSTSGSGSGGGGAGGGGGGGVVVGGGGFSGRGGGGGGQASASSSGSSFTFKPVFPPATIGYALLIAVIVSILAGVYPAWRASQMEPIDALRSL